MADKKKTKPTTESTYPPVVAVLGHVDHGKTTLLDAIRKTSIAAREVGGITQKIGASSIEIIHEDKKRSITFIDTPGHEAFSQMRGRGAKVADLALLVVAATEGLKPQSKESIGILKSTNTRFIVVLTKSDLPNKNPDKVKQELLKEQITLEEFGGDVPAIEVSAKTNHNMKELLDLILLVFDLHKTTESEQVSINQPLEAIVIESRLDPKAGPKATIVVKSGLLKVRDEVHADTISGKIRSITDDKGKQLKEAGIGQAVEILGLQTVPPVGSIVRIKSQLPAVPQSQALIQPMQRELTYKKAEEAKGISIVLVADSQGSLEAIAHALPEDISIIQQKTGEMSEADILLAKSTGSLVLGFNVKIRPEIQKLALTEKVLARSYTIIYEMLDEIKDALEGKLQSQMEQIYGQAKVLAKFPFEKTFAFGIQVSEGRVAKGDRIRILRKDDIVGETTITSLRLGKNPTSKVEKGNQAGIVPASPLDIQVGDMILSHS